MGAFVCSLRTLSLHGILLWLRFGLGSVLVTYYVPVLPMIRVLLIMIVYVGGGVSMHFGIVTCSKCSLNFIIPIYVHEVVHTDTYTLTENKSVLYVFTRLNLVAYLGL